MSVEKGIGTRKSKNVFTSFRFFRLVKAAFFCRVRTLGVHEQVAEVAAERVVFRHQAERAAVAAYLSGKQTGGSKVNPRGRREGGQTQRCRRGGGQPWIVWLPRVLPRRRGPHRRLGTGPWWRRWGRGAFLWLLSSTAPGQSCKTPPRNDRFFVAAGPKCSFSDTLCLPGCLVSFWVVICLVLRAHLEVLTRCSQFTGQHVSTFTVWVFKMCRGGGGQHLCLLTPVLTGLHDAPS